MLLVASSLPDSDAATWFNNLMRTGSKARSPAIRAGSIRISAEGSAVLTVAVRATFPSRIEVSPMHVPEPSVANACQPPVPGSAFTTSALPFSTRYNALSVSPS
ncbi:hypothetical protein OMP38_09390 [Cohnella ginsengisoli]|uniref:Uncharacterized protein n=1 Tax=Cohnella ginsengisoli TaxID=425004 RepID=A0A9X4KFX1_9BACL|nr:hypothetical protein [Cohnella ginsengisoli]MDG0791056.1 hypothetical protein [Cohnella ginsengisoli]